MNRRKPKRQAQLDIENHLEHDERRYYEPFKPTYRQEKSYIRWDKKTKDWGRSEKNIETPFRVGVIHASGNNPNTLTEFYIYRPKWYKEIYHKPKIEDIENNIDFMIDFCNPV